MNKVKTHKGYFKNIATLFLFYFVLTQATNASDIVVMAIFGDTVILKVDGNKHKLKLGEKTPEGIMLTEVAGDSVELKINGKKNKYPFGGHVSFGNVSSSQSENQKDVVAKIWPRNDMYITQGSINNLSVQFMVDTGATWVAMSEAVARRLGINYFRGIKAYAGTASGVAAVYKVTLDKVKVGDIELRYVRAAVIPGYRSNQVLLGNSFLKRVEMTRTKSMMILKKK